MRAVFAASAAVSALCFAASTAMALGLGPVVNATRLGQPLDFSVVVKLDTEETLATQCVAAEVMAGDNRLPAAQVHARLVRSSRAGEAIARITTSVRLNEPVIAVTLSLGCPPRLSHKFVSLLDPPSSAAVRPAPAPRADALKPAAPVVAANEAAIVSSPADAEQRARERELLLALEERLERQRLDNVATQQAVAALQARLRESEQARRDNPAIYGLTTLVVLLLGSIAVLLWRVMRLQSQQTSAADSHDLSEFLDRARVQPTLPVTPPVDEATMTSMRVLSPHDTVAQEPTVVREATQTTIPAAVRVRHQLSAEELIDLEQQADFFVALGQEDAAIDLLMGHVRSSGGTSPMPYLKLLEIYRRRSDGDAYERIRERFNRRFNGHAPAWESDPRQARSLEDYPAIVSRLQAAWKMPAQALDLVEALLFRRDASDETFEMRAYEELLFLYAIVRDVVEHTTNPDGVDLLLPLGDDDDHPPAIEHAEVSRVPQAWLPEGPSVDVELDLDSPRRSRI